ncbi:unnamed protein product [Prunus armeniaca]
MVLRRLENQGSYDILMNGFSLQSTTTPRKANKGGVLEGQSRPKRFAWWSLIGASHCPDHGFCPLGRGSVLNALVWWLVIRPCLSVANLTAWCSGLKGCASTRDVLLLDAVRLCASVPARSTVHRDDAEVRVEDGLNVALVLRSTPNQTIVAERGTDLGRGAPVRCSESDDRMIYGVSEAITGMVLRRLENQGSPELSIYRSPGGTFEADKTCAVESNWGKWVVKSAFGIVKYSGLGLRSMVV